MSEPKGLEAQDPSAYVVFCDDVRHELGGKLTFVGVYSHHLVSARGGVPLPKLVVFLSLSYPLAMVGQVVDVSLVDTGQTVLSTQVPLLAPAAIVKVREDQPSPDRSQLQVPIELVGYVPRNGATLQVLASIGSFKFISPTLSMIVPDVEPQTEDLAQQH